MRVTKQSGFTLIEVLIVLSILGIIASYVLRVFYGDEMRQAEISFFDALGISEAFRNLIYTGLVFCVFYSYYLRSKREAKEKGVPVISKPVKYFAVMSITSIALFLFLITYVKN